MNGTRPIHRVKTKELEWSTTMEQALHVILWDADDDELEVLQFMNLARRSVGAKRSADIGSERICPSLKVSSSS